MKGSGELFFLMPNRLFIFCVCELKYVCTHKSPCWTTTTVTEVQDPGLNIELLLCYTLSIKYLDTAKKCAGQKIVADQKVHTLRK